MNTIQYGSTTTQVDITKYVKASEPMKPTQQGEQTQQLKPTNQPETQVDTKAMVYTYDELKTELINAKIPITEENIKTAGLMIKSGIEVQKENMEAAADIKKQVEYVVNHINEASVAAVAQDGLSLDKITIDILADVISQVNAADKNVKEVSEQDVKETTKQYITQNNLEGQFSEIQMQVLYLCVENLMQQDLPITLQNVQALVGTVNKSYEITGINSNSAIGLIKKGQPPTLENLYIAKYSSNPSGDQGAATIEEEAFKQLLPQIEKLIEQQGIEDKDAAVAAAKSLLENGLPVTAENLNIIVTVNTIGKEGIDIENLVHHATQNLKLNKEAADVNLYKLLQVQPPTPTDKVPSDRQYNDYQNILKNIANYDDETIKQAVEHSEVVTLKDLQIAYENIKQQLVRSDEKSDTIKSIEGALENTKQQQIDVEKQLKTVTAKRQLAEIRLRLTTEAMTTLLDKGIEIDTLPLKEAVDELKALEAELYKSSLNRAGVEASDENLAQMEELYQKLDSIKMLTPPTYSKLIQAEVPFTIDGLSQAESKLQMQQAATSYEVAQTQPSARFGDNFTKVSNQIEPLVTELGLEASEDNIRAAEILVKNNMEVTTENITAIKLVDMKVEQVTTQLHPVIAANMIKDGFNIVQTDIDEVIEYMKGFNELLGEDLTDKIASYIYDMDQASELTATEREAMIGIYRMLYSVEKTAGRATGFLVKNDMPLTLGNLMEASKYYDRTAAKRSDIDVNIDDAFGALEEVIVNEKSIKAQLGALQAATLENANAQTNPFKNEYEQNLIAKFIEKAQPEVISKLIKQYPDIEDMPIEKLLKAIEPTQAQHTQNTDTSQAKATTNVQEFIKNLNKLVEVEPTTMLWMKKHDIPLTVSNIETMQNFIKDAFFLGKQINGLSKSLKDKLGKEKGLDNTITKSDLLALKEGKSESELLEDLQEEISKAKKEAINLPEQQRQSLWKQADNLEKVLQLQKQVQKDEAFYQIPIQLSSGLTNMNLYVMNDKEGNGKLSEKDLKVFMSMETQTLGTVQIYMKLSDKNVSFQINTDQPDATKFLQANQTQLQASIEEIGYRVGKMGYGQEQPRNPLQTQMQPQIKPSRKNLSIEGFEVII